MTVQQPWAWAIVRGNKDVENRTGLALWRRLAGERVLVHAGIRKSDRGMVSPVVQAAWQNQHGALRLDEAREIGALSRGCVIGEVTVGDVHAQEDGCCESEWAESMYRDAAGVLKTGVVHLPLSAPHPLRPFPVRGRLGPWRLDDREMML